MEVFLEKMVIDCYCCDATVAIAYGAGNSNPYRTNGITSNKYGSDVFSSVCSFMLSGQKE
uniref:hypothetical protein n=1 Tax=Enterococcus mundtii TaxID=53346 RepID=UPI0021B0CF32|nr:hypothetical protein [Enterococcus mundtii]